MGWLSTQVEQHGSDFEGMLIDAMQRADVYDAIFTLCGPFGVRRFMLGFTMKGHSVDVTELETLPLQYGGGAPSSTGPETMQRVKLALNALRKDMQQWAPWSHGTLGVVRNCDNEMQVIPFFDDDIEGISVDNLPTPPQGHPLEDRAYINVKASVQAQMEPVYLNTMAISHDWAEWAIDGDELRLLFQDDIETTVEKKRCKVLATFDESGEWAWQVPEPLFSEEVFCWEYFLCDWDAAMELGMLSVARLNGTWLFYSSVSTDPQVTLFVAVWD